LLLRFFRSYANIHNVNAQQQASNRENEMKEIAKALNQAQAKMNGARTDKTNPHFRSDYASLASVFDAIRDPFSENGLCVSQPIEILENGRMPSY